ncbi:MAG: prephenate dehydratase [Planctomycetota bacterium]|nr:prephenate dehydratase [Planctomycetota bacterium]
MARAKSKSVEGKSRGNAKGEPGKVTGKRPKAKAATGEQLPAPEQTSTGQAPIDLTAIRERINLIDRQLVELVNQRAGLVVEVGKYKRASGMPVYVPSRDVEVVERALRNNRASGGIMPDRAIEAIYRELMSGSFALQQPLRIGYLGPAGSYSHEASVKHFGSSVEFVDVQAIGGVFSEVERGHVNHGLVPIENSIHGGIVETLDAFRGLKAPGSPGGVMICGEVQLEINHCLLANTSPDRIARIYSKPEVFSQCRQWLSTQYPRAELVPTASSSRAATMVADESKASLARGEMPSCAAVGSELAGQIYGLNALFVGVQDEANNLTRFLVLGSHPADRTGDDKTSLMFIAADKPGALVSVLSVFDKAGINLTHIDKRPSGRTNWTYTFFIDAQGHQNDEHVKAALTEARTHCRELLVLGSYPRSKRIL